MLLLLLAQINIAGAPTARAHPQPPALFWSVSRFGLPAALNGMVARSAAWPVLAIFTVLGGSSAEDSAAAPRVWTVFCAECTNNFDYKCVLCLPSLTSRASTHSRATGSGWPRALPVGRC
jgi:hypothetical protein